VTYVIEWFRNHRNAILATTGAIEAAHLLGGGSSIFLHVLNIVLGSV
jgi:hypothetical protein